MRTSPKATCTAPGRRFTLGAFTVALLALAPGAVLAAPRVVVTVKPLHSLVAGVMAGVGEPELIIRGAGSPHTYSLKPSDARLLEGAQVIFWVGESLETFMEKPLAALGSQALIVEALRLPGIALLAGREGGAWDAHEGHGAHEASGGVPETRDGHLWLDPDNARVIARETARMLGRLDPDHRGRYAANAAAVVARVDALDSELRLRLVPVRAAPFIVFHDAYQYFERHYGLRAVGSVAVGAERAPGARRVQEIRETIRGRGARCVFSEPQFSPALIGTLLEGTSARTGTLDPLGAAVPAGPDAYFILMKALGSSLADCLQQR